MTINVSATNEPIEVSTSGQTVTATVSGGQGPAGPTGPTGPAGTTDYGDLTNVPAEFTPEAHAASHAANGSDPVTIATSQVANFASDASDAAPVQSVAGKTGTVSLVKGDVGLGNVDNTSDANKPISTATQTALDGKADQAHAAAHAANGSDPIGAAALSQSQIVSTLGGVDLEDDISYLNTYKASATHAAAHATEGADPLSPADIGAADASHGHGPIQSDGSVAGEISFNGDDDSTGAINGGTFYPSTLLFLDATQQTTGFTPALKTKLDGVASNATANSTDAQLRDRSTHTGTQAISTVSGLQTALDAKAASAHVHSGADITTGTVAAARLGAHASTHNPGGADATTHVEYYDFTNTSKPASATGSSGSYSWTIPTGAKSIAIYCVGAGGGGGSGRRGAAGTACCGGGGGGSGGWSEIGHQVASLASSTLAITVPAGGAGGAAPSADNTNGNAGSDVNTNTSVVCSGATIGMAFSATGGQGGTSAATVNGGGAQWASQYTPNVAATTPQGKSGAAGGGGGNNTFTSGFGGGGGGADAANNQYAGGAGGGAPIMFGAGSAPTAGTAGGGAGANGVSYASRYGTGGAGGGGSNSAGGGAGGNGAFPGGGGGGAGGGRNGATGGAGGNGAGGYVRITVWY